MIWTKELQQSQINNLCRAIRSYFLFPIRANNFNSILVILEIYFPFIYFDPQWGGGGSITIWIFIVYKRIKWLSMGFFFFFHYLYLVSSFVRVVVFLLFSFEGHLGGFFFFLPFCWHLISVWWRGYCFPSLCYLFCMEATWPFYI